MPCMSFCLSLLVLLVSLCSPVDAAPHPRSHHRFSDPRAHAFQVEDRLPGIPFDLPTSWAGSLPISAAKDAPALFFWYFPPTHNVGRNHTTVWLSGGPGCSSMIGLLQENGPISMPYDTTKPVPNPYSWTKLSGMLYVDQPAGVGLSVVKKAYADEVEIAQDFTYFLERFFDIFHELKSENLWLAGESYAGQYIPYIAQELYANSSLNLQGMSISNPIIGDADVQKEMPAIELMVTYQKGLNLTDDFISEARAAAKHFYGTDTLIADNLAYPPKGIVKVPEAVKNGTFFPWKTLMGEVMKNGSCVNPYNVQTSGCIVDPLGMPPNQVAASAVNFLNDDRRGGTAFKKAIHAPDPSKDWLECGPVVFDSKGDQSRPSAAKALPAVIERSRRVVVTEGVQDTVVPANGTRLTLQNMVWGGKQGFQKKPSHPLVVGGSRAGTYAATERGLTYIEVAQSGHMVPQDAPAAAYKIHQFFLGQISEADLSK